MKRSRIEPGKPQALFPIVPFVANLVIGLALSYVGNLLAPKTGGKAATIRQNQKQGQNIVSQTEFAPKVGFDSLQNVVELGSTIPVIYAKREIINGFTYGGVRVNTNLIWSQMQSYGGNQLLRAIFLVGEGFIDTLDPMQFAFGDNTINGYDLGLGNANNSRVTFYQKKNGGRIQSSDRIAGRAANKDPGNATNLGAPDVFYIRGMSNKWRPDFCYSYKPSTQTQFGVYSPIGVGLGYRVNPSMRPAVQVRLIPKKNGDAEIQCDKDGIADAQRQKYNHKFKSRSGIIRIIKNGVTEQFNSNSYDNGTIRALDVGDTVVYYLEAASDASDSKKRGLQFRGPLAGNDHFETCNDVAQAVASRQKNWDDSCSIGDLYKLGTAQLICESRIAFDRKGVARTDEIFASEVEQDPIGGGMNMEVTFRVVQSGTAELTSRSGTGTGTSRSHLFKLSVCAFSLSRATQVLELGFKSNLGIRISGLCNFRDAISENEIDARACESKVNDDGKGEVVKSGQSLELSNYQSGTFSGSERRYSFFRIGYRVAGSTGPYLFMAQCFGFSGITQQNQFNYIRLQMPKFEVWEFKLVPLSGWEIRSGYATGELLILDSGSSTVLNRWGGGGAGNNVGAWFNGRVISRDRKTFQMACTRDRNLGVIKQDSKDYADDWGKLAETYVFDEIQSSARTPEHELAYINIITPNTVTPQYGNLALIGMNIRSSTEFSQLKQLSVYVTSGLGGHHTFPKILQDLFYSPRYGIGATLSPQQWDDGLLNSASTWTRDRRYFWDGALPEPVNIRQWASTTAPHFLLDFIIKNGKFALQPAVYFDQAETITNLYTSGNIIEDTFEFAYADTEQRIPKRVSVKWRHERPSNLNNSAGIFPLIREINIREQGTPADAPLETIDLTDFCTNQDHAIDVAKYMCRVSRLITHSVSFKTVPTQAGLEIGRCFKLGLETVNYSQPNNGVIGADGTITSIDPIPNGTYDVLLWTGTGSNIQDRQITVVNGKTTTPTGSAVFCIKQSTFEIVAYKVQSLSFDEEGNLDVEATVFPLDSSDHSLITAGWDVAGNWIIEGEIAGGETDEPEEVSFDGINIIGPSALTKDIGDDYTVLISGSPGTYTYYWYAEPSTGVVFSARTSATTRVTASTTGDFTLNVEVSQVFSEGTGITFLQSKEIEVIGPDTLIGLIGTVEVKGPTTASTNAPAVYTVEYTGQPAPIAATALRAKSSYQIVTTGTTDFTLIGAANNNIGTVFTATGPGTGSGTAADLDDVFVSWNWTSTTPGASATIANSNYLRTSITFLAGGAYNITCTISSPSAADSPQTGTLSVTTGAPSVTVEAIDAFASETTPPAAEDGGTFTLTRTEPLANELIAVVQISGTAIKGIDYNHSLASNAPDAGWRVVFAAGVSTAVVPITIISDAQDEAPETITLDVSSGLGYNPGTPSSATITIRDKVGTNLVYAGPSTGTVPATPIFRPLEPSDLPTNLAYDAPTRTLSSSTGDDVIIPEVVPNGNSGLMTGAAMAKLDAIDPNNLLIDIGTPGTYTKVTTDAKGRVISGSNPTTLAGYGIGDTYTAAQIDALVQGLKPKEIVRVATTGNITLSGLQTIDGIAVAANDRVLVKDQTNKTQNGFYKAASGAWTRTTDFDTWEEVPNAYVFVREGTVNAGDSFVCTSGSTLFGASEIGTSDIEFITFSLAIEILAGTGLVKTGSTIALANTSVTAGSYGSASQVATFTIDAQGRLTAAANAPLGIGTTANLPVITTTGGALTTGAFGTGANDFTRGNDSRLSPSLSYTASTRTLSISTGNSILIPEVVAGGDSGLMPGSALQKLNSLPATVGTVTSVNLALPTSVFSLTGNPITTSGTITAAFVVQSPHNFFAGPAAGGLSFAPTFRLLVAADLPDVSGLVAATYGTASSVPVITLDTKGRVVSVVNTQIALSAAAISGLGTAAFKDIPPSGNASTNQVVFGTDTRLSDARAPIYGSQNANLVLAGPTTGATPAIPTFRALVAADIPNLDAAKLTSGTLDLARLADSGVTAGTYNNSATAITPFTVDSKGRITTVGTAVTITPSLTSILANSPQAPNIVLAGPATGTTAATPTFRALVTADLPNTTVTANSYGSATQVATFTVDSKGRLTAAGNTSIAIDATGITSGTLAAARLPAFTGDATSTAGTSTLTLAASGVTAGTYNNSATAITPFTVDSKGRITAVGTAVTITPSLTSILANSPQAPNIVLAGPAIGTTAATPTFRALVTADLPNTTVTANSYGSATQVATFTVDSKGRLTAAGNTSIAIDATGITSGTLAAARLPAFTGDATSTAGTSTLTLAASGVTAGIYKSVTVDIKGRVTAGTNPTTLSGYGITDAVSSTDSRLSDARTPLAHFHGNITNSGAIGTTASLPIITTTNGALTTGSFGNTAGTFCQGNDSRLSDARTPLAHSHGNITNAGAIGTTASLPIITTTNGALTTGSFGNTAGTFCQGNDSRLSDARTPLAHNHDASAITTGQFAPARLPAFSGHATSSVGLDATLNITLANSGVTGGNYGSTTTIPAFTVDSKGRITSASNVAISPDTGRISGEITQYAGATPPTGWLKCNGDTVPNGTGTVQGVSANFAPLFAVLQSTYGGAGKLPDLRGEFVRGWDDARGVDSGRVRGSAQADQIPFHGHSLVTHSHTMNHGHGYTEPNNGAGHTHAIQVGGTNTSSIYQSVATNTPANNAGNTSYIQGTTASQQTWANVRNTTGISITGFNGSTGSGGPTATDGVGGTANSSENRPRNTALLYIIKI